MAGAQSFEDLIVWKNSQELGKKVYDLCIENPWIKNDFTMKNQIKSAALTISNNIAEGFEYNNHNQFIRFLTISKGSCGEVRNCLLFLVKVQYISMDEVRDLIIFTKMISGQLENFIKYLRNSKSMVKTKK